VWAWEILAPVFSRQEEKWNLKFFLQNRPDLAAKLQKGPTRGLGIRQKSPPTELPQHEKE
jgi:hypothetical protein